MRLSVDKKTIIIAAFCLITGLAAGMWMGGGTEPEADRTSGPVMTEQSIFTCSMHPQIRQGEPGDCPICGMDLIPLIDEGENAADAGAVRMSPHAMALAEVKTARVRMAEPEKQVRLTGRIESDPRRVFRQSSHVAGRIETLSVNYIGAFVRKGQAIATVYSPELVRAKEELIEAVSMKQPRPELIESARQKLLNWKLTETQIDAVVSSKTAGDLFRMHSDVSGHVIRLNVRDGDYIGRGSLLFEAVDLSRVWVMLDVYESDLVWIRTGDRVDVAVQAFPGERFSGDIVYIDPIIDPRTRVTRARVELDNPDMALKPDMFVSGAVGARLDHPALIVPKTAVMWTGRRSLVYVRDNDGDAPRFRLREVVLGPALSDDYVVRQGLAEGETIAVHGTFSVDAAAQLAGKPSMMSLRGSPAVAHSHGGVLLPGLKERETVHADSAPQALDEGSRRLLKAVYDDYLAFKDALAADDIDTARARASAFKARIEDTSPSALHGTWLKVREALVGTLAHAAHQESLADLRKTFQAVSRSMVDMARGLGPADRTLYVQHCPMADDNKGADWLSADKEIRNPYYGKSMLSCGEVTATIGSTDNANN
ncbi:hypothetical protein JCM14469_32340 [Desulfatiferula olefinivorans]